MKSICVKNNSIFPKITSQIEIYATFKLMSETTILEYQDIEKIINDFQLSQTCEKIMVDNFISNEKQVLFLLFIENKILILDELFLSKYMDLFKKMQPLFLFPSNKIEDEFFTLPSKTSVSPKNDLFNFFSQNNIFTIQTKIINSLIMKSQILTRQRHQNIASTSIDIDKEYKFEDFIRIKLFRNNVHLCYNLNDQLLYVLKLFDKGNDDDNKYYQRELTFYKTIANKNQFICKFFGIIENRQKNAIIIEYIEGKTLEEFILDSDNKITYFEKMKIILEILMTAEFIHLNDLVLRDLKWDNIVIDSNQNAIFIDFDRVRKILEDDDDENITKNFGCEYFLSPEQILNGQFSPKSDIFSIGLIIHFILNEKQYNTNITISELSKLYNSNKNICSMPQFSFVQEEYEFLFDSYKNCFEINPKSRPNITELFYKFYYQINVKYQDRVFPITTFIYNTRTEQLRNFFGIYTFNQHDITCDIKKLVDYLTIASNCNDSYAQYFLGRLYFFGECIPFDLNKAMYYLKLSLNNKNSFAQLFFGWVYETGQNLSVDPNKSLFYYNLAVNQNNKYAENNLAALYEDGIFVKKDIQKAMYYYKRAASHNCARSQFILGYIYFTDLYSQKDIKKAVYYLTLAAEQKEEKAYLYLAFIYIYNNEIKQDVEKGLYYYNLAIKEKNPIAFYHLGILYYEGKYIQRDITKSIEYWTQSADLGNSDAQFVLGKTYYEGRYIQQDVKKSIHYLTLASNSYNSEALNYLGQIYYYGKYIQHDINKSIYYLNLAANQKNHVAECLLGIIYFNDKYIKHDIDRSVYYLKNAANNNIVDAQKALGIIYYDKKYNYFDINKAIHYFTLASKQDPTIYTFLGFIYYKGVDIVPDIHRAIHYFEMAADHKEVNAYFYLGNIYSSKLYIKKDYLKAAYYYTLASNQDHELSQYALSIMYYHGNGVPCDVNKSIYLLKMASKKNIIEAQYSLGLIYCFGKYIKNDIDKGIYYLKLASDHGNAKAQLNLALIYYENKYNRQNLQKAFYYFSLSAKNNNDYAQFYLGRIYYDGLLINRDIKKSIHYYKESSSFGNSLAKNNLGVIYMRGEIVEKNVNSAIEYFEEAIKGGNEYYSYYNLAKIYYFGLDVDIDIDKSISLLEKAANNNLIHAVIVLLCIASDEKIKNNCFLILKNIHEASYLLFKYIFNPKKQNKALYESVIQFFHVYDLVYPYSDQMVTDIFDLLKLQYKKNADHYEIKTNSNQLDITASFYEGFYN